MTDLSTEALMARRKLAEQATPGPWKQTVILYDDEAGRYYDCVDIAGSMIRLAVYWTGNSKMWGGKSVYEMKDVNAVHIAANDPDTVIATIDELLRLRAECARLEREANWLAFVLANACCGVPLSEYIDMDINCMSPPAPEHWRDTARKSVEEKLCPKN